MLYVVVSNLRLTLKLSFTIAMITFSVTRLSVEPCIAVVHCSGMGSVLRFIKLDLEVVYCG